MRTLLVLLFFLAQPFWETKPPETWNDTDIETILRSSPWVAAAGSESAVTVYFATATPIEQAQAQLRKRSKLPALDPDYVDYLAEHRDDAFVLAIPYPRVAGAGKAEESTRMQEQTEMKIGRKTYKILGHFPPTPSDPVLRLVFPRAVKPTDKLVEFKLYLANLPFPEREVSFFVKDLFYRGNLEM
jgi:hypothetical protein